MLRILAIWSRSQLLSVALDETSLIALDVLTALARRCSTSWRSGWDWLLDRRRDRKGELEKEPRRLESDPLRGASIGESSRIPRLAVTDLEGLSLGEIEMIEGLR